ncbi:hypothetical protein BD324DRAFT_620934 [Kockovaella imperatae]|uniref:RRM domain-containing protein n=1 Tax=Kockovaella imperatae TaxID=4999 RepID=A0A1Y1UKD3_9TREE|nr:hypothetical protein BD324DRAFT_620934 [Kockovaella imperatae]ORX38459.1 hypothetical protein BD324DRAFT_620934 [Kockovaella imperatae]
MDIDKSLEEIIASKPRRGRNGRGGARRGASAPQSGARARYAGQTPKSAATAPPAKAFAADAMKIIISNLPNDVTEAAVRDLMQSTVGPVKSVQMTYTATGKSTGQATILFKNKGDANKAHASYHNRMIDNQRPMKVEIALDPNQMVSLASRVAPAAPTRGKAVSRGRGAGRARNPRPAKKSAEELDADMAAYKSTDA